VRRTVKLLLHDKNLLKDQWEMVLPEALHAVRSLVCFATNETPHERLFRFSRREMTGTSFPSWRLPPGPVLLRRFVRRKDDPLSDEVQLAEANPSYAVVHFSNGRKNSVSTSDLASFRNLLSGFLLRRAGYLTMTCVVNNLNRLLTPWTPTLLRMATFIRRRLIAMQRLRENCAVLREFADPGR